MAPRGERRMLFDMRGRRRHVVRVVYAVLALLMGASLFLVIGPFNLGELVGGSGSSSAAEVLDEQAERTERRLVKSPTDEALLLSLARTRIGAGNAQVETEPGANQIATVPPAAQEDFEQGLQAWNRYLKQADEPSASAAQLVAGTFFKLAENSTSFRQAEVNIATAATAQAIAAEQRPSLGSLSSLAIYQFFNGEFAAGDKTAEQAAAKAPSATEAKNVEKQLTQYRKSAKKFASRRQQLEKVEREVNKKSLTNPLGELAGPSGSSGE